MKSSGNLYSWGCGDGKQLDHTLPNPLSGKSIPTQTAGLSSDVGSNMMNDTGLKSFDSRLDVLIPRRVEYLRLLGLKVKDLALSTHCMALICSKSYHDKILED